VCLLFVAGSGLRWQYCAYAACHSPDEAYCYGTLSHVQSLCQIHCHRRSLSIVDLWKLKKQSYACCFFSKSKLWYLTCFCSNFP
jgi:hypothetical protein